MIDVILEMHWSNNPIPLDQLIECPDYIFDIPLGLFTSLEPQVKSVNGKDGIVILDAVDVGADAAGSAEAVQQNLNTEVDTLNIQLDSLLTDLNSLSGTVETKANAASVVQALSTKADLINGVIPAVQLPSFVDDVLEYESWNQFPSVGEAGKIYIDTTENKTYRWSGSTYVVIGGGGVALGETAATAYRGDRGKAAYDHSLSQGNPHNATTSDIAEGTRQYFTLLRVLQTKLQGLFPFNDAPITELDDVLGGFSKAQSQINALKTVGWINATSITGFSLHAVASQNTIPLKFAKKDGMLWISGALNVGYLQAGLNLFTFANSAYLVERFIAADLIVNTFKVTVYYQDLSGPTQATMDAYLYRNASNMTLRLQYQLPNGTGATIVVFNPMPLGRLLNP